MLNEKNIFEVLKNCYDPEISINIVDLGLIYNVKIISGNVNIKMTLTALGCPLSQTIIDDIKKQISTLKGVKKVNIKIVFDPPWNPDRMSPHARQLLGI